MKVRLGQNSSNTPANAHIQASSLTVSCVGGPFISVLNKLSHKDRGLSEREEHQP